MQSQRLWRDRLLEQKFHLHAILANCSLTLPVYMQSIWIKYLEACPFPIIPWKRSNITNCSPSTNWFWRTRLQDVPHGRGGAWKATKVSVIGCYANRGSRMKRFASVLITDSDQVTTFYSWSGFPLNRWTWRDYRRLAYYFRWKHQ